MTLKKHILNWIPTITWALLIFKVSSIPSVKVTENGFIQNIINNLGHFTEYGVLTILFIRSYSKTLKDNNQYRIYKYSIISSFIYSLSDEFHQYFVPGRMSDIKDILMDILGMLVFTYIHSTFKNKRTKNHNF